MAVLDKGLKHAPVKNLNKFNTYIGIQKYIRKINIKKYMLSNPASLETIQHRTINKVQHRTLRNNSIYNPQVSDNQHIEVFKKLVLQVLDTLNLNGLPTPYILRKESKHSQKGKT